MFDWMQLPRVAQVGKKLVGTHSGIARHSFPMPVDNIDHGLDPSDPKVGDNSTDEPVLSEPGQHHIHSGRPKGRNVKYIIQSNSKNEIQLSMHPTHLGIPAAANTFPDTEFACAPSYSSPHH